MPSSFSFSWVCCIEQKVSWMDEADSHKAVRLSRLCMDDDNDDGD